uniref:Uncharacterized protein n=1 Tax=Panagrolaimus superbus TaxID=310955 RepID=A0A914YU41_9BILA
MEILENNVLHQIDFVHKFQLLKEDILEIYQCPFKAALMMLEKYMMHLVKILVSQMSIKKWEDDTIHGMEYSLVATIITVIQQQLFQHFSPQFL